MFHLEVKRAKYVYSKEYGCVTTSLSFFGNHKNIRVIINFRLLNFILPSRPISYS